MKIPIRNLYFLLSYAWDVADELPWEEVGAIDEDHPVELLARLLIASTDRLIRRGLDRGYISQQEELKGLRGRINIASTLKRVGHRQGRLVCQFDELRYAVPHNQVIKATLLRLSKAIGLEKALREQAHDLFKRMQEVPEADLSVGLFLRIQLHGNVRHYRLPVSICRMLFEELLPTQDSGRYQFATFSEEHLFRVFEKFLQNFFKHHLKATGYDSAKRERFVWQKTAGTINDMSLLPYMETDLSLLSTDRRLVIESKFYKRALVSSQYAKNSESTLISGHLYQLFAYLKNLQEKDSRETSGVLIYPTTSVEINSQYIVHGHSVSVATVNLNNPASQIRDNLLRLVTEKQPLQLSETAL